MIATYVTSVARLEQQAMTPPYLRETGIRRCQRVLRLIGGEGVTGIVLVNEDDTRELYLTAQATVHAAQLLQVRHIALGSIDGTLEAISVHQKPRFTIYHSWTHKAVTCDFSSTDLLEQAESALRRQSLCDRDGSYQFGARAGARESRTPHGIRR